MNIGIDIGGTKCAVVLGDRSHIVKKLRFETTSYAETVERIFAAVGSMGAADAIGISCGGPLDSRRGIIQAPPNLPGWDNIPITKLLQDRFGIPAYLCNDANACALAEWSYGAGKGTKNMIFLTFGTGMGAGLILNGKLYEGTNGMAGEVGHLRMAPFGPVGYGKQGSFEGFCSGGGLAQLGKDLVLEQLQMGKQVSYCKSKNDLAKITAKSLSEEAQKGDPIAKEVFRICGEKLGEGLAYLVDLFNPERIVIGSIFQRAEDLLRPHMEAILQREALPHALHCCRIVAAELGDAIGDYAALAVSYHCAN